MMTANKVATGIFEIYWNNELTKYRIVNGSAGMSGRGVNEYMICHDEQITYAGSLQRAKKILSSWLQKQR